MKDSFEINKNIWTNIYKARQNNLAYPNENLVRYLFYLYPDKNFSELKVLDYGFGSGSNLRHLDALGCDVYGVEICEYAKQLTLEKLRDGFDADKLFIMDQEVNLPYEKKKFDLVIAWQVLYYNSIESLAKVLYSIKSILKPEGKFIGTMARKEDISITNSKPRNKYERVSNEVLGNQAGSRLIAVSSEDDIKKLFNMFSALQIGYFESNLNNIVCSHWIIYGENENE